MPGTRKQDSFLPSFLPFFLPDDSDDDDDDDDDDNGYVDDGDCGDDVDYDDHDHDGDEEDDDICGDLADSKHSPNIAACSCRTMPKLLYPMYLLVSVVSSMTMHEKMSPGASIVSQLRFSIAG